MVQIPGVYIACGESTKILAEASLTRITLRTTLRTTLRIILRTTLRAKNDAQRKHMDGRNTNHLTLLASSMR